MAKTRVNSRKVALLFGEGGTASPTVLGGKGAGLSELAQLALPVPPGFTVTTSVARAFAQHGRLPVRLERQLNWQIGELEKQTGKRFGSAENPLLVSVRSGAAVSMPGMMETVLNLGLNKQIVRGLAESTNKRFAFDCYRRFLAMYGDVVLGVPRFKFEQIITSFKALRRVTSDTQLDGDTLEMMCGCFRTLIEDETGSPVPEDPQIQLLATIIAVLASWNNERAKAYRQAHKIPNDLGTAVNVQTMVYGNRDENSCTGVVFSCNVATGEPGLWGEFLVNAQGEDVVAGTRTPLSISELAVWNKPLYDELLARVKMLAAHRRQVMDIEFTVESGKLWLLQHRRAKMTPEAAATVAVHDQWSGKLTREKAIASVSAEQLEVLQRRAFEPKELAKAMETRLLAKGLSASPGAAWGMVATSSEAAVEMARKGAKVILVRPDTSPDDLPGMLVSTAIVTESGGSTSHAAIVARELGIPAVVGCEWIRKPDALELVSVDGQLGAVLLGSIELAEATRKKETNIFLRWVTEAESQKKTKPRLVCEMFYQSVPLSKMINDFYLTDMMTRHAKGTSLYAACTQLKKKVHTETAERICTYLVSAVSGELRYANDTVCANCPDDLAALQDEFEIDLYSKGRYGVQVSWMDKLKASDEAKQRRFLELGIAVFRNGKWSSLIGGARWADIGQVALDFLTGKLSHSLFADHAFDLQHNCGCIFGKNSMIACNENERSSIHSQLEVKKYSRSVRSLYLKMMLMPSPIISPEVEMLYRKGEQRDIWKEKEA